MKRGRAYHVTFWDHAVNTDGPIKVQVLGWLMGISEMHLLLTSWDCELEPEHNAERSVILRSAIISCKEIRGAKALTVYPDL